MKNTGFIRNGVCNASVPLNSMCPAPLIDPKVGFYADPNLVRSGNTSTLKWSVTNATGCAIQATGFSLPNLGTAGSSQTSPITGKSVFTLTCVNGPGGPSTSANATVNLIPTVEEI